VPAYNRTEFGFDGKGGLAHNPLALVGPGPRMPCEVRLHAKLAEAMVNAGQDVPPGVHGEILIDSGASMTCVEVETLQAFGLTPVAECEVFTPSGVAMQGIYACGMAFPGTGLPSLPEIFVLGSNLKRQKIVALLGRDVLSQGVFVYNGSAGHWSLSF
jgi:hypothetical protein